jgi:hypothetical protein
MRRVLPRRETGWIRGERHTTIIARDTQPVRIVHRLPVVRDIARIRHSNRLLHRAAACDRRHAQHIVRGNQRRICAARNDARTHELAIAADVRQLQSARDITAERRAARTAGERIAGVSAQRTRAQIVAVIRLDQLHGRAFLIAVPRTQLTALRIYLPDQ